MIEKIIYDLLWNWCNYLGSSLIFAVVTTSLFWCIQQMGWKEAIQGFCLSIINNKSWRYHFLFFMYSYFILDRALLSRHFGWTNGRKYVLTGGWGLYAADTGEFTLDAVENFIFFIPFIILYFCCFSPNIEFIKCIKKSLLIGFLLSLFIEMNQLFFKIGEFQISDLVYNTTGTIFGGFIYWIILTIKKMLKC